MKTLLDTTKIGSMSLKNRFISAAIGDAAETGGHLTETILKKYETLAKGGVGTIITGFTLVDEMEGSYAIPAMYANSFVDEYIKMTDIVHAYKANIILQLVYIGSYVMGDPGNRSILGPSAVANINNGIVPKEMTISEIKDIQTKFAQAAVRAKKAGFDGIEIHAAHGFLLSQFLTPYYNRRSDSYGGPIENRARMILETYSTVRQAVGNEYPIWIKINCTDGIEGGISVDDFRYVCAELSRLGVNAIEVSGNWIDRLQDKTPYFKDEAAMISEDNQVAVVLTGGNRDYTQMEQLLNNTNIGYFGMARPFLSDPNLPIRYEKEHSKRTRCVSCNACLAPENVGSCILNKSV
ncbi:MAG: NADH:flavin oxidoreductase/nadh oxidase [Firmicutes bacterium]|nr:NADH:flavin oxidoreductase/nadh oxidase [Bacillota bacterium]